MKNINQEVLLRSLSVAVSMFLASAPILLVIPSMMAKVGFDSSAVFLAIAFSCAVSTCIVSFACNLPLILGPGIAGASYLAIHLGMQLSLSLPLLVALSLGATLLYFLTWLAKWPSIMLKELGPIMSRAISAMLGVFLIRLTLASGFSELGCQGWVEGLGKMALLWGIPVLVIEWSQRKSWSMSYLLGMGVCYLLSALIDEVHPQAASHFIENSQQGTWPSVSELWQSVWLAKGFLPACFGLWLIQTIDVAGCTAAMSQLAHERDWTVKPIASDRKIQGFAPLGNLLGFMFGPLGFSGIHCLHLSSALALCSPQALYPRLTACLVAGLFVVCGALSQVVDKLPFYLASPVVLWVALAMLRQLPWNIRKEGNEVIAGAVMALSVAFTCDIAVSMALGFWMVLLIRYSQKQKIGTPSWLMALGFGAYMYLVR